MRQHVARIAGITLLQQTAAAKLLRQLNDAGIPVVVLKGLALIDRIYEGIHLRPMGDIDLLVKPEDLLRADAILQDQGYAFNNGGLGYRKAFAEKFMGEVPYSQGAVVVDLHWHLVTQHWYRQITRIDFSGLWERAVPMEVAGVETLRLSKEDELLHLCFHTALHHGLAHPRSGNDIARVLQQGTEVNWAEFTERAILWKVRVACWATLSVAHSLNQESVPQAVLDQLQPPRWRRKLLVSAMNQARGGSAALTLGSMRFLGVLLLDNLGDLVKVIGKGLVPGQLWLQLRFGLSKEEAFWRQFTYPLEVLYNGAQMLVR